MFTLVLASPKYFYKYTNIDLSNSFIFLLFLSIDETELYVIFYRHFTTLFFSFSLPPRKEAGNKKRKGSKVDK